MLSFLFQKLCSADIIVPDSTISIRDNCYKGEHVRGKIIIPEGVQTIGNSAFDSCQSISGGLNLPNSLQTIGNMAFAKCYGLTGAIKIPEKVISIGTKAFVDCNRITAIEVDPKNSKYASINGVLYNKELTTLIYCPQKNTNEIIIPNTVTTISDSAFKSCDSLSSGFVIPDSVTTIERYAFYCSNFKGKLPNALETIGESAFEECHFSGNLIIPSGVKTIGMYAFYLCLSITGKIVLPDSLTSLSNFVFHRCYNLEEAQISETNPNYKTVAGILYDKNVKTLIWCPSNKKGKLNIPDTVTTIKDKAFFYCNKLEGDLVIPDSVVTIEMNAFRKCTNFKGRLILSNSLTQIQKYSFAECTFTGNLVIPDSVTTIFAYAFSSCAGLGPTVTLSASVVNFDQDSFLYCHGIEEILVDENNQNYASHNGMLYSKNLEILYFCPFGKHGKVEFASTLKEIESYVFYKNYRIAETLDLPPGLETIGSYAFYHCKCLTGTLKIPE